MRQARSPARRAWLLAAAGLVAAVAVATGVWSSSGSWRGSVPDAAARVFVPVARSAGPAAGTPASAVSGGDRVAGAGSSSAPATAGAAGGAEAAPDGPGVAPDPAIGGPGRSGTVAAPGATGPTPTAGTSVGGTSAASPAPGEAPTAPGAASPGATGSAPSALAPTSPTPPTLTAVDPALASTPASALAGRTFVLDPGHNGGNAANPRTINALVPDGRGGRKACNTVGTQTNAGYPEHAFNWDVANRVAASLRARGATVVFTRPDDAGVGPCVDVRGQLAGQVGATALVSLHANGTTNTKVRGFFAIVAPTASGKITAADSALAGEMIAALKNAGFPTNSAVPGGLSTRTDLGTLNFATTPAVMLELGEMRNPGEAAVMSTSDGRQRYADALVAGIVSWASRA